MSLRIGIIGAGALGCTYSYFFNRAGIETITVGRKHTTPHPLFDRPAVFRFVDRTDSLQLNLTSDYSQIANAEFIFVLVKTYDTESVARELAQVLGPNCTLVTLQNGLGNQEILEKNCPNHRVVSGVSYFAVSRTEACEFQIGMNLKTSVHGSEKTPSLKELFKNANLELEVSQDLDPCWKKLILSAPQNALSALTGLTFGQMKDSPHAVELAKGILNELSEVAKKTGVTLPEDLIGIVLKNWGEIPQHRSSMLQDITAGRRTEVQSINGAISKLAREHGTLSPVNDLVTSLILAMEEGKAKSQDTNTRTA